MPNHIANRISGSGLDDIRKLLKGPEEIVDFNMVIPIPAGLQNAVASLNQTDAAKAVFSGKPLITHHETQKVKNFDDERWANFILCLNNIRETGYPTWYEWCIENWGTKWNAYAIEDHGDSLYFETAWGLPRKVLAAVIAALPDASFIWEWADEDYGANLGVVAITDGLMSRDLKPADDLEEWAMRLHGMDDEAITEYRAEVAADE